jgi:HCOMODA/2-hydroxy-3-carboxy-muconic semialdehyde decarboxylase
VLLIRKAASAILFSLCVSSSSLAQNTQITGTPASECGASAEQINDLVAAYRILYWQHLIDQFGHVSMRCPGNPTHFLIGRSLAPAAMAAEDIVELDLSGGKNQDSRGRENVGERFIHSEIYRARPDVNAIVHSHSPALIPFTITPVALRPTQHMASFLIHGAPLYDNRKYHSNSILVLSPELGKGVAETLGKSDIVLMRAHGAAIVGASVPMMVERAVVARQSAEFQLAALSISPKVDYLTKEEAESFLTTMDSPRGIVGYNRRWLFLREQVLSDKWSKMLWP